MIDPRTSQFLPASLRSLGLPQHSIAWLCARSQADTFARPRGTPRPPPLARAAPTAHQGGNRSLLETKEVLGHQDF